MSKTFSADTYGFQQALKKAVDWRNEQLKQKAVLLSNEQRLRLSKLNKAIDLASYKEHE